MEQVNVGRSGLRVSRVGLGCNNFGWSIDAEASRRVVDRALDAGVTLFDTADYYGSPPGRSEEVLGELLKGRRDQAVVATKFGLPFQGGPPDNSRGFILRAVEASLQRLQTDRIDLYMIHWPDVRTPMEETLRALDDLIASGKVLYIACSNLAPWRIVESKWIAEKLRQPGFIAAQDEYSLLARGAEKDLVPALSAYGMSLIPYFPLASGLLSGKYLNEGAEGRLQSNFLKLGNRFLTEANVARARKLADYAQQHGHSLLELAMSWLAAQPVVSGIIAGATKPEQVEQNVAAASWALTREQLGEIDALLAA